MTKHGSKRIRWIIVKVAHAASKKISSKLSMLYLHALARRGANVVIVAQFLLAIPNPMHKTFPDMLPEKRYILPGL
jgi:hypothetical protein